MIRPTLWLMGKDVLLHAGKPEGAGYAAHSRKQIRLVDGIQSEQTGQRIPGNSAPSWNAGNFPLCRWDNFLRQKPQIVVRTTGARLSIFESRRTVPGRHFVVPVQITDCHQCKRWTASSLRGLIYLLSFVGKGIEVDNRCVYFKTWENRYGFAFYRQDVHSAYHLLSTAIKVIVLFMGQKLC